MPPPSAAAGELPGLTADPALATPDPTPPPASLAAAPRAAEPQAAPVQPPPVAPYKPPPAPAYQAAPPASGGYVQQPPPVAPQEVRTVCPSGTAPSASVDDSRAEPDPHYGENAQSMGHRYRVTASGVVRNDASATVSLNYNRPVTVAVDRSQTILDDVRVSGQVDASGTASWTASGYYTFYGDTRHWQPSLTATVEGWSWSDYKYRDCPR